MRTRHRSILLLLAPLLVAGTAACGDDSDGADDTARTADDVDGDTSDGTNDDASTGATDEEVAVEAGDVTDPCTLLSEDDFAAVLDVSINEPEDVSDRFSVGGPEVESHTCQWEATTSDDIAVSVYSVELLTVPDDADGDVYAGLVENARRFDGEVSELDLGDEAVGVVENGSPEILVRSGEVLLDLSTASDDLTVDDLRPLAEAALSRVDAG